MVDIIVLLIIIFFMLVGWGKGWRQFFIELLITAVSLAAAWYYYQQKQLVLHSLLVFIGVYLALSLLKWFLLRLQRKRISQSPTLSFANRFGGVICGLIWGAFIASLLIFTLDLLPLETVFKSNIKQKVQASRACQILHRTIKTKKVAIVENISYMAKVSLDEKAKMRLRKQPEVQELLEHKSLKAIIEDPETISQLQNKDLPRLLTNPKILKLLNDGQFIEKAMKLDFKKALEK